MQPTLSDAQEAVLRPGIRLIEACPGAGKTRAIVARYTAAATTAGRAAALLSFTNAAVDEVTRRCANTPQALTAPNFVGTFDRFLHRYLVTPALIRLNSKPPRYVDSYDDLPVAFDTKIRRTGVHGQGLALGSFRSNAQGQLQYSAADRDSAPSADRPYLVGLEKAGIPFNDLAGTAQARVNQLTTSGIYDCEQSRLEALKILRDPNARWLHQRLAERFAEVIVDEFQDCSSIEQEILRSLHTLGIHVVVVADPDQAIYEFRQAEPGSYLDYRDELPKEQVVYLDDNWRSSPAICNLVSSLRTISTRPIVSQRRSSTVPHADTIYVTSGTLEFSRVQFEQLAAGLDIDIHQRLVLASTRKDAAALSGHPARVSKSSTLTGQVIRSAAALRYSADAAERKSAIVTLEEILLGTIKFPTELRRARREDQLLTAGLDRSELRMMVAQLVDESEAWTDADSATLSIRTTVEALLAPVHLGHTPLRQRFKTAKKADWHAWSRTAAGGQHSSNLPGAHIHAVKGAERDAVLLYIEDDPIGKRPHVLQLWAAEETHEARRVLYVGASRARRLLVLAVSPAHLEPLRDILSKTAVPALYLIE